MIIYILTGTGTGPGKKIRKQAKIDRTKRN